MSKDMDDILRELDDQKVELACGHYVRQSVVDKCGTCCVECKYCQRIVCIAEPHRCAYNGNFLYDRR